MKIAILLLMVFMAGCSAGNLSVNRGEPVRVSKCEMTDNGTVTYVQRGVFHQVTPNVAHFENTVISQYGNDLCTETGLLCPKGE